MLEGVVGMIQLVENQMDKNMEHGKEGGDV